MPRRPPNRVRRAAGALGEPYFLTMMGGPMTPVHFVAGRMRIDPAARPRKVTVVIEHHEDGGSIRAERVFAVKRKSGWRVYIDWPLGFGSAPQRRDLGCTLFLHTGGPLDPRDEHIVWSWGWESEAARALAVSWALR